MKRRDLIIGAAASMGTALAARAALADQNFTAFPYSSVVGTAKRTQPARIDDAVWAPEFGTVSHPFNGNNTGDDSIPIQAAVDYAVANHKRRIILPDGVQCRTASPIYLDLPSNIRANPSDGGGGWNSQFSLALEGAGGSDAVGNYGNGCAIRAAFNNLPVIILGPGRKMGVRGVHVLGPDISTYRNLLPSTSIGIGVSHHASETIIEDCMLEYLYEGLAIGYNGDVLADSNRVHRVSMQNCFIGASVNNTQNDINVFLECNIGCSINILGQVAKQISVIGGNYSQSGAAATFTIGTVSALFQVGPGFPSVSWQFTAVVSSPSALFTAGVLGSCALNLPHFGVVPILFVSWNAGTSTATFAIGSHWLRCYYYNRAISVATGLSNEIQASTTIYCAERTICFNGSGFKVQGIHVEGDACSTLIDNNTGWQADTESVIRDIYMGIDPAIGSQSNNVASFYCQYAWPFINQGFSTGGVTIEGGNWAQSATSFPVNIEADLAGSEGHLSFKRASGTAVGQSLGMFNPNVRYFSQNEGGPNGDDGNGAFNQYSLARHSEWDETPFLNRNSPGAGVRDLGNAHRSGGIGTTEFWGVSPKFGAHPRLYTSQLTVLQAVQAGGGGTPALGTYALMDGQTVYEVIDDAGSNPSKLFAKSAHRYFTYGQTFTVNWGTIGGGIGFSVSDVKWFFSGLVLSIDIGDGSGVNLYLVTGVYPGMSGFAPTAAGFVAVWNLTSNATKPIPGVAGTIYTGTTVGQQPYSITQY